MTENQTTHMLHALFEPGDCFEIRIFDVCRSGDRFPHIESGYFDYEHIGSIPSLLDGLASYTGVYVTMNPVNPALLARANNRLIRAKRGLTTSDEDIITRRWLFIDIDPVRPAGISATDSEKANALDKLIEVKDGLASMGFTEPLCVDSGNGFYLIYRIDGNPGVSLIKETLEALSVCSDDKVHIDTSVHNAARICRLAGTFNRKGEDMPDRPHRLSELLEVPDRIEATLLDVLQELAGISSKPEQHPAVPLSTGYSPSAIDEYNSRGDITALLETCGWKLKADTDQQYWWRPGKAEGQHSATFNGDVFYVFSSNAQPFEHGKGYSRFAVYSMIEHGGDNAAAIEALEAEGYGNLERGVDLTVFMDNLKEKEYTQPQNGNAISIEPAVAADTSDIIRDPGPIPTHMLRIPGFISELMDYCIENAPVRNPAMAFCGSLALQSVLGARKVRDPADNRTNLYLIGLAPTGGGKDFPRMINQAALQFMGWDDCYVSRFGSGEAIEDKLASNPVLLCQTDEMDGLLYQVKNSKDSRWESLTDRCKEFFTSASSKYPTRCLAGKPNIIIDQPSLTIFGTAVPVHYYSALSEKILTDGFFSRTICVEASQDIIDQEPNIIDLPQSIKETLTWWANYRPTPGDIANIHPIPRIIELTEEAKEIITDVRVEARRHQNEANAKNDVVKAAVWSRVRQMTRKLALIYAISANHKEPVIDAAAISWARDFVIHQAKRMLFMANDHVSENPFHAQCLKVIKRLRESPGQTESRRSIMRHMKCKATELNEIVQTLYEQGRIEPVDINTKTKPAQGYKLIC